MFDRFQWANLQIRHLARLKLVDDIKSDLGKLPETLEDSYSQIWTEIRADSPRVQEITTRALMWVLCGRKDLDERGWAVASYHPEPVPSGGVDTLYDFCRNLVVSGERRMIFAHLSVQEYLEKNIFSSLDANSMAAKSCLMSLHNLPDTFEFKVTYGFEDMKLTEIAPFPPLTMYAIQNWPHHVELCYDEVMGEEIVGILQDFIGTSTKPGKVYARWAAVTCEIRDKTPGPRCGNSPRRTDWWTDCLTHVMTSPQNPSFLLCYFRFREALNDTFEWNSLDCNKKNSQDEPLLSIASDQGVEQVIDILLTGVAPTGRTYFDSLMAAIHSRHVPAMVKLLDWGKSNGAYGGGYETILKTAAESSDEAIRMAVVEWVGCATEPILRAAAKNQMSGKEPAEPQLARDDEIQIAEAVRKAAAANDRSAGVVIKALVERNAGNARLASNTYVKITGVAPIATEWHRNCGEKEIELLLAGDGNITVTEAVLVPALKYGRDAKEIVRMLVARDANMVITESVFRVIIGNICGRNEMIQLLLTSNARFEITDRILVRAVGRLRAQEIEMLLASDTTAVITEAVLVAAAGNFRYSEEIIEVLLARDTTAVITEAVLVAVARTMSGNKDIMERLLARDTTADITEAVLVAAAGSVNGADIIEVLLARDTTTIITEAILVAAARNTYTGGKIIEVLLARDRITVITEAVLVAVAGKMSRYEGIMDRLLARDTTAVITEAVLVAVARRMSGDKDFMERLLARDTTAVITEAVLVAAARNRNNGAEIVEGLLARDRITVFTEAVLVAVAGMTRGAKDSMEMLLARDSTAVITKAVLVAAAGNQYGWREVLGLLLARDTNIQIIEALLLGIVETRGKMKEVLAWLITRDLNYKSAITEAVLLAVAKKSRDGKRVLEFLLATNPNIGITEAVLVAVAEVGTTSDMEFLLARDAKLEITETLLAATTRNSRFGVKFIDLFLERTTNLTITLEILEAAAKCSVTSVVGRLLAIDTNIEALEVILAENTNLRRVFMSTLLDARREFVTFNRTGQDSKFEGTTSSG